MACNCGKSRRLPAARSVPAAPGEPTRVVFWVVPPDGSDLEPVGFPTLREARWHAQRQRGPGWSVEGRREPVAPAGGDGGL